MSGFLELTSQNSRWVISVQLFFESLNLLSWEECEKLLLLLNVNALVAISHLLSLRLELLLGLFGPVEQWLFHKDLTGVQNQTFPLAEGIQCVHHSLLVSAF